MVVPKGLEIWLIRHHQTVEEIKGWSLIGVIALTSAGIGYVGGRADARSSQVAELGRLQAANATLLAERQLRVDELRDQLDYLTKRTTEAAVTSTEAAKAATDALSQVQAVQLSNTKAPVKTKEKGK